MRWSLILVWLVLLLACDWTMANPLAIRDMGDPNAVHRMWVGAVEHGDVDDAAAAVAPLHRAVQATFARDTVLRMQAMLRDKRNGMFIYGALHTLDTQPVIVSGQQATGISVWHFAQITVCYQADLVQSDGRWGVMAWHQQPACGGGT